MTTMDAPRQWQIDRATSMWDSILAQVPTLFGKLLWVASFRVPGSNLYRHPALEQSIAPEIASRILEQSHRRYFQQWLTMGIQKQHDDFLEYLEPIGSAGDARHFIEDSGNRLVPASAIKPQRLLFETDMAVVLELLD